MEPSFQWRDSVAKVDAVDLNVGMSTSVAVSVEGDREADLTEEREVGAAVPDRRASV
jgi:hypothetical protein